MTTTPQDLLQFTVCKDEPHTGFQKRWETESLRKDTSSTETIYPISLQKELNDKGRKAYYDSLFFKYWKAKDLSEIIPV